MRPSRAVVLDLLLTTGVVVGLCVTVSVATEPRARPVDLGAYLMAALIALPIPLHRRRPLGALLASAALLFVYYSTGYPGFSPAFALSVQLYFASLAGKWRWATGVTLFYLIAGYIVLLGLKDQALLQTLSDSLPQVTLLAGIILFGEYARSRRELAAETRERLRQAEESREREAARRVAEERLRIARELHDTVAHSMATITVQAGSALHLLGDGDDGSRAALTAIRRTGRQALAEMRATLGMLRDGGPSAPAHGLDRMPALLDELRTAGLRVDLVREGSGRLAADVDHVAYRIVQEALTNVLRHAGPVVTARVSLTYAAGELRIEVADDGAGPPGNGRPGNGLTGMRERAEAVGGSFAAGRGGAGGFTVSARLPVSGVPEDPPRRG
ncbi:sensor histidine kinase [Actinoallomurus spadix]|uniref:histidine kinase n=1 Tax=Actinoallomurus spadix TaxID=79912 RepID=A0ABN0XHA9_9ACTN|nr:sensor histidine kinase [Actinoallomurus spadix]MCO5987659.1 sensor histidine kinase [Actinoallomurus spadix]